jgi:hypothetical protein
MSMITLRKLVHSDRPEVARAKEALANLKDIETRPIATQAQAVQAIRECARDARGAIIQLAKLTWQELKDLEE